MRSSCAAAVPGRARSAVAGNDFATRGWEKLGGFRAVVACVPVDSSVR